MTQIIKPKTLSLISKTYGFQSHLFSVGAICFFKLGEQHEILNETEQWPKITSYLNQGVLLDAGFAKTGGEFLLAGNAYSSQREGVTQMKVSASLANIKKELKVVGDRFYSGSIFAGNKQPKKFTSMPLGYQQAYGGSGFSMNPYGKGVISKQNIDPESNQYSLPNIYYPEENISGDKKIRKIACFEPLDISWPQRSKYQGTYDQDWLQNVHPGFPDDTKPDLFNAAPEDQQSKDFFQPGDPYELQGMHPTRKIISGKIPSINVRAFIQQKIDTATELVEVNTNIDTVWFFPELELGVCIYRGVAKVNDSDGLDVKRLLLAYERAGDKARSKDYYQNILYLRTESELAVSHALNESQLTPEKTLAEKDEIEQLYQQAEQQQESKQASLYANLQQQHLADLKKNESIKEETDKESDNISLPPIPEKLLASGDVDLSPYLKQATEMSKKCQQQASEKLAQLEEQKKQLEKMSKDKGLEAFSQMKQRVWSAAPFAKNPADNKGNLNEEKSNQKLPADIVGKLTSAEDMAKIKQADAELVKAQRQSRQMAPQSSALQQPLPEGGAQQIRQWVLTMLKNGTSLAGRDLAGADLSHIDFSGQDLRELMLENTNLSHCRFIKANLDGAVLTEATLEQANFNDASMQATNLSSVNANQAKFKRANLSQAKLLEGIFTSCDFSQAVLDKVLAMESDMTDSSFDHVCCQEGQFSQAKLNSTRWRKAQLHSCILLKAELLKSQWQQAVLYRCIMIDIQAKGANFDQVSAELVQFSNQGDLSHTSLRKSKWITCGFRNIDLSHSVASESGFIECDLTESDMSNCNFNQTVFSRCIMLLSNLTQSSCREVLFNESTLKKAIFDRVDLTESKIHNSDLGEVEFVECQLRKLKQHPHASIN